MSTRLILASSLFLSCMNVQADQVVIDLQEPTLDRWFYPFNGTPGTRTVASTFGNTPDPTKPDSDQFDNRDGQVLLGFDTGDLVEIGQGAESYQVLSLSVTMSIANENAIYDDTYDPYTAFLPEGDPDFTADVDPGQPIELYGVGYRNGFNALNFPENGPFGFGDPLAQGVRNLYAIDYFRGNALDISNNVRERFDPSPWAIGIIQDGSVATGESIPEGSLMTFEVHVDDPDIQAYLAEGLNMGRINFCITSLTKVVMQGGDFPNFYMKENPLVDFDLASAASLSATIQVGQACPEPADINCDGIVNGEDLGAFLGAWGTDNPNADFNTDGLVDGVDLGYFLGKWGPVF